MFEREIARGIAALDVEVPGWRGRVDATALDLNDARLCVLGQVTGHYTSTAASLLRARYASSLHGFSVSNAVITRFTSGVDVDVDVVAHRLYARLTAEWRATLETLDRFNTLDNLLTS